jgi:hypothetical protein
MLVWNIAGPSVAISARRARPALPIIQSIASASSCPGTGSRPAEPHSSANLPFVLRCTGRYRRRAQLRSLPVQAQIYQPDVDMPAVDDRTLTNLSPVCDLQSEKTRLPGRFAVNMKG